LNPNSILSKILLGHIPKLTALGKEINMAEIGLAASIIAVIQTTTSVAKQAYKY
jgi:hypothetical protein